MAKMFYTMDETKAALAKNEEEIKQLAREGRLREFRDGPRLMFKADQVEQLKAELGSGSGEPGGDAVTLSPSADSGAPLGLVDGSQGGGSVLGLVDSVGDKKGDTQFADIGLSGSLGGIPSPKPGDSRSGTAAGGSAMGSRAPGITIFDVDESQRVDPSAQTAVGGVSRDQVSLESVGSGSGLLDLTRESDDTSLGAVFDELTPAQARRASAGPAASGAMDAPSVSDAGLASAADMGARASLAAPIYIEAADPMATALGALALGSAVVVCIGLFLLGNVILGYRPDMLGQLAMKTGTNWKMYMGIGVGIPIIFFIVGLLIGKSGRK